MPVGIKDRSRRGSDASATSARSGFGRRIWEALPLRKRTSSQSTVDMSRAATPSSRSSSRMSVEGEGTTDLDATITQKPQSAMRKCSEVKGRQESRVHENLLPGSTISSAVSSPPSPSCQSKLVERLPTAAPEAYKISDTGTMVKVPQEGLRPEIDIAMFEGINPQQSAKKILTLPAPEPRNESPKSLPAPSPPNATDLPPGRSHLLPTFRGEKVYAKGSCHSPPSLP
ncbi:uncharacterized protein EI90DRAFT_2625223 [Cantharellus anzutake]|uniref:uncharacterized protein n=1 Tax=Cantharellus anzutake TaxID=1750568 RepID=UPI0019074E67|nr:uncharacterized protein EI90DRAFT_2625223 [Cantharellus anzutake]KAF8319829.1 hypothetical protein EI90DRAFT_2625223 [Cantharellus anzutake]